MFQLAACLSDFDDRSDEPIAMIFIAIGATRQGARRETASVVTCSRIHRHIVEALAGTRAFGMTWMVAPCERFWQISTL